ncbi:hypothetical protein GCM10007352_24230 [Mucilaginibacter phyllosphaerae]|nr:hypothetical protein GCM10007352_24230 [Mucilaginibacter phyllosphaerae]
MLVFWSACKDKKESKAGSVEVVSLKTDDQKFLALKDTAQAKLPVFLDSLKPHALDSNYRFLVKSDFVEGKNHEHMWSVVYKYAGGKFTGIFADSAIYLKNIKMGDPVSINQKDVEDWAMYDYKRNTDMGNFSDKYLRSKQGK